MRLKRVFGKLSKASYGTHRISGSRENARDLEWFMERYPLEMEEGDRSLLGVQATLHRKVEQYVFDVMHERSQTAAFELALPPREYQKVAATMMLNRRSLLLADDVGLGKTVSFICTLTKPETLPAAVVTLAHLPRQWRDEMNKFAPGLNVHVAKSGQPYPFKEKPDVVVLNYHKLNGWAETLARTTRSVCFDECQELRHAGSQKYAAARHLALRARYRMGLSATPIYNYGGEFYSVLDVVSPGSLGERDEFMREWTDSDFRKPSIKNPKAFGMYLRDSGLMLRRTREDVGRELPALSKFHQYVEADPKALDAVGDSCAELARLILRAGEEGRGEKMRAREEFNNRLRQATGIAKAPYVAAFVRLLVESGERVVLYGWHREVYSIWLDRLSDLRPVMYTGTESITQKENSKKAFTEGDAQVLIMSLRSGAGLDGLQGVAKTLCFGELDWSPGVHEQCIGRVHRDGQPGAVMAYFMVSDEGADPMIAEVLGLKRRQIEGVRTPQGELIERLAVDGDYIRRMAERYLTQRAA
jgi:SNF2 family DNA or RNA helicase